jgi:hypothetical protein
MGGLMMTKKGQGATEYLIILAVIIVIALIVVGVLGGIPGIGSNSKNQAARAYWETAEVGIVDYSLSAGADELTFKVKNNQEDSIVVDSIVIGDATNGTNSTLTPGSNSEYKLSKDCENQGDAFDFEVTISYENVPQVAAYANTGSVHLIGVCAS